MKHVSTNLGVFDALSTHCSFGRSVGLLTLDPQLRTAGLTNGVCDLIEELSTSDALVSEDLLAHWLATSYHYDSIVIDASDELLQSDWFGMLEEALIESGCSKRSSIMYIFRDKKNQM
jgi:hypothetical protein